MIAAIGVGDDLRSVAFKVCTALHTVGATAVLTGGSAATIYAPTAYISLDVDYIAYHLPDVEQFHNAIAAIGFERAGRTYRHPLVPITLDFPSEDILIGSDHVDRYATFEENGLILHVVTATDCVRDRLASFFWYSDRSALEAACAVALRQADVSIEEVRAWAEREGEHSKFQQFFERLNRYKHGDLG